MSSRRLTIPHLGGREVSSNSGDRDDLHGQIGLANPPNSSGFSERRHRYWTSCGSVRRRPTFPFQAELGICCARLAADYLDCGLADGESFRRQQSGLLQIDLREAEANNPCRGFY